VREGWPGGGERGRGRVTERLASRWNLTRSESVGSRVRSWTRTPVLQARFILCRTLSPRKMSEWLRRPRGGSCDFFPIAAVLSHGGYWIKGTRRTRRRALAKDYPRNSQKSGHPKPLYSSQLPATVGLTHNDGFPGDSSGGTRGSKCNLCGRLLDTASWLKYRSLFQRRGLGHCATFCASLSVVHAGWPAAPEGLLLNFSPTENGLVLVPGKSLGRLEST